MDHTMLPAVLVCETACICGVSATVLQTCVLECYGRVGCPCSPGKRSLIGTNWLSACIGGVCGLRWTVCSPLFRAAKRNAFAVGLRIYGCMWCAYLWPLRAAVGKFAGCASSPACAYVRLVIS
jgi:hypothetical protein